MNRRIVRVIVELLLALSTGGTPDWVDAFETVTQLQQERIHHTVSLARVKKLD